MHEGCGMERERSVWEKIMYGRNGWGAVRGVLFVLVFLGSLALFVGLGTSMGGSLSGPLHKPLGECRTAGMFVGIFLWFGGLVGWSGD